jgi:exopolysaccharide production protein ExoQ
MVVLGVLIATPLVALAPEITDAVNHFLVDVLGKDPTLTGRTYLWARADEFIALHPVLGHGYQVLWLSDSADTTGLLRWAHVSDGRAFNFHHTYRQVAVDIGLVGLGVFIATLAASGIALARKYVVTPSVASTFFLTMFILLLATGFTELIVNTFSTHTILLYVCMGYAFWRPKPSHEEQLAAVNPANFAPYARPGFR